VVGNAPGPAAAVPVESCQPRAVSMDWGAAHAGVNVAVETKSTHGSTERVSVALLDTALSCTTTSTSYVPVARGFPVMRPSGLMLSPAGNADADQEYSGTPLSTAKL